MPAVAIVPPPRLERRMTSGLKAIEARSARSRKGQQTRRLARAIAGDRPTGIRCSLDRLGIEGGLRDHCELLFACRLVKRCPTSSVIQPSPRLEMDVDRIRMDFCPPYRY